MARYVFVYFLLWVICLGVFSTWRQWTGVGVWKLSKALGMATLSATVALAVMSLIVYLF